MIDIVMQTPERFSTAVRAALESELPSLHPAVVRSRFHFRETGPSSELIATMDKIAERGSQGVILKAPDLPEIGVTLALADLYDLFPFEEDLPWTSHPPRSQS